MSDEEISPYTPAARHVVESAPTHAAALGHGVADTGHLLVSLVAGNGRGMARVILREMLVQPVMIQRAIEQRLGLGHQPAAGEVPLSEAARRALNLALQENPTAGPSRIGTDHVLLGLLAEGGLAAEVLAAQGVSAERVRTARTQARSRTCYGCLENAGGEMLTSTPPATLPAELTAITTQLAAVRRAKANAIDAQDYEQASGIREEEKALLPRALGDLDEQTAKSHLATTLNLIMHLQAEVDKLVGLLHHHHGADMGQST
ncbi:Clp protease N-terminal domain-containing protein [Actinomadura sp. 3N508]|uniref:Clp protease N-terminal domain-containing protein n=1 Tax=Actinomadura sp. 3N508 TaxID=3375153 RepID=UPI003795A1D2